MLSWVSRGVPADGRAGPSGANATRLHVGLVFGVLLASLGAGTARGQTVRLCGAPWIEPTTFAASLQTNVVRIPPELRATITLALTECEDGQVTVVASVEGHASMRRVIVMDGWSDAEKNERIPEAMIACASGLASAMGMAPAVVVASPPPAVSSAPIGAPPSGETSAGLAPAVPSAYGTQATRMVGTARAPAPSRVLAPMDERRSFSFDGGIRLYTGSTGAYSFRFRIAWPRFVFDYRYAAISLDGTEDGDSIKLRSQLVGFGYRWRHRVGRGALALSALADLGVTLAHGRSSFASSTQAGGAAAMGVRGDAELVYPFGRTRLRVGIEVGYERGIQVHAVDAFGVDHTLGGFDGAFVGFYGGFGFGQAVEVEP